MPLESVKLSENSMKKISSEKLDSDTFLDKGESESIIVKKIESLL